MKAMIFAAGLGTRLKPITDTLPKALVPIAGKTLLEHVITKLAKAGFDDLIINVHHHADMICSFLKERKNFGLKISISDERKMLLDTGGGIRKAAPFFNDGSPFLVHNVDIISDVDLRNLYQQHCDSGNLATLLVKHRDTARYLLFDRQMRMKGWTNVKTGEVKSPITNLQLADYERLAFSGIHVISPKIFEYMENFPVKFPIMDFYISNCGKIDIGGIVNDNQRMIDVGKIESLAEAERLVENMAEAE